MSLRPFTSSLLRTAILPVAALAVTLTTGCANMQTTATPVSSFAQNATLSGKLHGGSQPISGSDVRLYAAGATGYGSAPTLYAVTTSAADGFGSFNFTKVAGAGATSTSTYGCPTSGPDPQMYITAKGGATQGTGNGTNASAVFIIALGKCSTIGAGTYVDLDEVTTVATMAALQQYFAPGNATSDNLNHLGYPASTQATTAFANAVATIPLMANVVNGTASPGSTQTATPTGGTASVTVSILPEIVKINTLANIIASCVNTVTATTGNCATLFTNAVPPSSSVTSQPALSFNAATDTLQALYYMLTNPTSGSATALTNLFNLAASQPPFQPMATVAPTDWTVGIKYSSASPCTAGSNFLLYAYHLAVDATGNIWAISNATGGNLYEISPTGLPSYCGLALKGTGMAIDNATSPNVWVGGVATAPILKLNIAAGTTTTWNSGTTAGTYYIAIDRAGDIFSSSASGSAIYNFSNGANTATPVAGTQVSSTVGTSPLFIGADTANRFFVTNSSTTSTFFDLYPSSTTTDATYMSGYDTASIGTVAGTTNTYGAQAGLSGTIATANGNNSTSTASNTLSIYTPTSTAGTVNVTYTSPQYSGGLVGPREIAIDGAGNIWSPSSTAASGNYVTGNANAATTYIITEFTATGTALSPGSNPAATSTATVNGGFQKDPSVLPVAPRSIVVDPAGNVWVGSNSGTGTSITELVGAAVPVVTPIAAALAAGATTTNGVSKP